MKTPRRIFALLLGVIGAGCLTAVCVLLVGNAISDKQARDTLEAYRLSAQAIEDGSREESSPDDAPSQNQRASDEDVLPEETQTAAQENASGDATEAPAAVVNPYRDSFLANEDMAAWLQIPGTNIDYPVMWTPRDENYYLYRDFEGNDNQNGSLILDTDSSLDPLTTNLIIHGHNMRSGEMFGNLTDYEDPDYCKEHSQILLYTEDCERIYEVIAVFRSQVYKKTDQVFKFYQFFQADTQEEFDDFYENIMALSLYDTGVSAQFGDRFLTLSTCVYHVEQGRFVVVAKETAQGDSYLPLTQ